MRWPDGPFLFSYGDKSLNTSLFVGMLRQLERRAHRVHKRIVLVIDNGSYHTSKGSLAEMKRVKRSIPIFWLPSYTSDKLNYIENLWKHLKEDYFSRMLVTDPKNFIPAAVRLLSRLRKSKALRRMLKPRHKQPV